MGEIEKREASWRWLLGASPSPRANRALAEHLSAPASQDQRGSPRERRCASAGDRNWAQSERAKKSEGANKGTALQFFPLFFLFSPFLALTSNVSSSSSNVEFSAPLLFQKLTLRSLGDERRTSERSIMLLEEDDGAAEEEVEAREDVAMRAAELDEEAARVNIEATGAREVSALIFFLPSSS